MDGRMTAVSFSLEAKERAVCLVLEHQGEHRLQWAAMEAMRHCLRHSSERNVASLK